MLISPVARETLRPLLMNPVSDKLRSWTVRDYDLAATLGCGQAFRWKPMGDAWEGVVARRWIKLQQTGDTILAECAEAQTDWAWLEDHLQLHIDLDAVLGSFPKDAPLAAASNACRGLRLLKQEPWECLASFICSSTKQIVQIQQIIALLSERFGEALPGSGEHAFSFPSAERIASASEADLRACKLGFRAPYLLATARRIASGELDLNEVSRLTLPEARDRLESLPGVGRKVADCALLFGFGFSTAFPVDVWVLKALRQLYFPKRRPRPARLRHFVDTYFGPNAGYAQQYLFHAMRIGKLSNPQPPM